MTRTTSIGVVGAGGRGRSHVDCLYRLREREYLSESGHPEVYEEYAHTVPEWVESIDDLQPVITAICDPDPDERETALEACREHGDDPSEYADFDAFLEDGTYDAVIVASPNDVHTESVIPLLERDVDLFVEKPLAATLEGHDRIIDAAAESDSRVYMGFNLRSSPFFSRLKERVAEGEVGDLGMISCHEVRAPFNYGYRYTHARSGGSILEKNCHDFDLFNWYADSDPTRVSAFGGQHVLTEGTDALDHATVIVEYASGVRATLELCLYAPSSQRTRRYELRGSEGVLRAPEDDDTIEAFDYGTHDRLSIDADNHSGGHGGADDPQLCRFLQYLRGEAKPLASLEDAKKASAVAIAAERAIREDAIVEIDEHYDVHPI
jgi:predicted dehydrogenase